MGRRKEYDPMQEEYQGEVAGILQPALGSSGLTLGALTERTGLDKGFLSRVINGKQIPSSHALALISSGLRLSDEQSLYVELLCGRIPSYLTLEERAQLAHHISQLESKTET